MELFDLEKLKIQKEYEDLKKEIEKYNNYYYNLNESLISDYEYDIKLKKLESMEEKYPYLKSIDSPTQKVGAKVEEKFKKVKHSQAMLSLSNTYNISELEDFDNRIRKILPEEKYSYILELKLDGLSINLKYEDGILVEALTRGDGYIGEDVTENIRQIDTVPLKLNEKVSIEVRGEIVLPISEFNRLNNEREITGESIFANPRNAASGTLRQLDSSIVKERNLKCYSYYLLNPEKYSISTHLESINYLKKLGFNTTDIFITCNNIKDLEKEINYWNENRKKLDYETDGLVIKINELNYYEKLGFTAKSPRWAIAYKFKAEEKETKLLDITYQVGRTGVITPVAELKSVNLSGSVVKRASLHNFEEIERLDLKINDIVLVEKAAEIIPRVIRVIKEKRNGSEKEILIPTNCPSCNSNLVKEDNLVALKCKNENCNQKIKRKIEYFVSRDALNIQGLGEKIIDRFISIGKLKNVIDLYNLKEYKEELISLDKMGEKSIEKLLLNIENSKKSSFDKIFYSLGIEFVGKTTSKLITSKFLDIDNILNANVDDLKSIEGIGEKVANSIYLFFKDEKNIYLINKMKEIGFNLKQEKIENLEKNHFLEDKTFLATGKLEKYTREEIKEMIILGGGKYLSSISKNLDYLIVGEKAGSKLKKALELGINILTEEEFLEKIK